MPNVGSKRSSVDGENFHARSDAGFGGGHAFNRVAHDAICVDQHAYGIVRADRLSVTIRSAIEVRRVFVVGELPAAGFDPTQGRARAVVGEMIGPESAPVVGSDLIEGVNYVIESVSLYHGRS